MRAYPPGLVDSTWPRSPPSRGPAAARWRRYGYRAWWGLPALPKLNIDEPARSGSTSSASRSTGCGSAPMAGASMSREEVPDEFWQDFRTRVKAVDPDAYIVAEIWHEKPRATCAATCTTRS